MLAKCSFASALKKKLVVRLIDYDMVFIFRIDGQEVKMMLWDTAGQEEFDSITKSYYRGIISSNKFGQTKLIKKSNLSNLKKCCMENLIFLSELLSQGRL